MKERLININLTNEVQPKSIEVNGADWIGYGDGEYKNNYPQYLIDLYNNSATNSAIINATSAMIAGEDFMCEDSKDLTQYVELKKFLAAVNGQETAHELFVKLAFDLKLQGAYAINVIWSKDKTKIAELHHIPVEQVRIGVPDEDGKVPCYYVCSDWTQYRKKEYAPKHIAPFNMMDRSEGSQLLYSGLYSPAMELYHTPDYVASTNWIQIDNLTSDFHLNNITNGFSGSYFINFASGIPTREERVQIEKQITKKFTGANNAGKFVLTFSDDANSKPEIIPIAVSDADKQYTVLNELTISNIMIGHRVTSPMLLGVRAEGQLGGRNELLQAYELYMNSVVKPFQNQLLKTFKKLLAINGVTIPLSIKDVQPLNSMFDAETLKEVLTKDEIREELGYEPLEVQEETVAEEQNLAEYTELDKFLMEFGEDEDLENWQLIDEDDAEGEHEDFDFEYNLEKLELASTGRAIPNAKSEQDGQSTQTHKSKFRVRYVYTEDKGLTRKSGEKREFCRKMEAANKVYRKEDIIRMGTMPVNRGWGLNGADTYSIWKFKGGGNCHHKFFRRIYLQAGEKASSADKIVTTTKARSMGFKPETNPQEVPVAPKRMPKNGFVNKKGY
tara:strand:- start:177 stop:2021 length:1845 start_codon:yes stop_codon:yes gene_type:complete